MRQKDKQDNNYQDNKQLKKRKDLIMKKIVLTMVAVMAFTFSFAETESNRFDFSCNMHRLSVLLDLDENQMEAVETIHNCFSDEIQSLASLRGPQLRHRIHQAVRKDAFQMKRVLNDKQFNTYMRVIVATIHNRHL